MSSSLYRYDESIPSIIVKTLGLIRKAQTEARPGHVLRCPLYHTWRYRGFICEALQCIILNSMWVGYVRVPPGVTLEWSDTDVPPFSCGIDFTVQDGEDTLVGFHTLHVMDGNMDEYPIAPRSVDYVAEKLRNYLDAAKVISKFPNRPVDNSKPHKVPKRKRKD